jgi:hypothetical protein
VIRRERNAMEAATLKTVEGAVVEVLEKILAPRRVPNDENIAFSTAIPPSALPV